jgi:hypothetical protein
LESIVIPRGVEIFGSFCFLNCNESLYADLTELSSNRIHDWHELKNQISLTAWPWPFQEWIFWMQKNQGKHKGEEK